MARIVFDLDGTLIDSVRDLHAIANAIMSEEGLEPVTLDQAREFIGNGVGVFVAKLRATRGIPDAEQERLLARFMSDYHDAVHLTLPYPGVEAALQQLIARGHHLGICTNKPIRPCLAVVEHLALSRYFGAIIGGDSLPVHKPDPAPLEAAFAALPAGPRVYVGDSEVDAETAQRAMVPFLLFAEGYRKGPIDRLPHRAAFSDFSRLPDLIETLLAEAA